MLFRSAGEGIDVGDQVETIGLGMERELFVARVKGMYFVRQKGRILYRLTRSDKLVPGLFASHQLRLITDKTNLRPGYTEYPEPKSIGSREPLSNWESLDDPEPG